MDSYSSGQRGSIGNAVGVETLARVRIPHYPPNAKASNINGNFVMKSLNKTVFKAN